jgi:hypothetical protein
MAEWCEHVAKVHIPADPDKEKDHEQALNRMLEDHKEN